MTTEAITAPVPGDPDYPLHSEKTIGRYFRDQVAIDQENNVEYQSLCAQCYFAEREKFYQRHPKVHI